MLTRIRKAAEKNDGGFTLIELLVVMIIIGILAAIAIPVFLNQRKKAVDTSLKSDLRSTANEMETYYTDSQTYPAALTALTDLKTTTGNTVSIVSSTATAYCLNAKAVAGKASIDTGYFYDSDGGGLLAKGDTCT